MIEVVAGPLLCGIMLHAIQESVARGNGKRPRTQRNDAAGLARRSLLGYIPDVRVRWMMCADKATRPVETELDETAVSRAELHIEREKIEIERERLALERERLAAERERWKIDAELKLRAEGRGIAFSTLVFVGAICVLVGVIAGFLSSGPRASRTPAAGIEALMSRTITNAAARGGLVLRPVDTGGSSKAYLLILD